MCNFICFRLLIPELRRNRLIRLFFFLDWFKLRLINVILTYQRASENRLPSRVYVTCGSLFKEILSQ